MFWLDTRLFIYRTSFIESALKTKLKVTEKNTNQVLFCLLFHLHMYLIFAFLLAGRNREQIEWGWMKRAFYSSSFYYFVQSFFQFFLSFSLSKVLFHSFSLTLFPLSLFSFFLLLSLSLKLLSLSLSLILISCLLSLSLIDFDFFLFSFLQFFFQII